MAFLGGLRIFLNWLILSQAFESCVSKISSKHWTSFIVWYKETKLFLSYRSFSETIASIEAIFLPPLSSKTLLFPSPPTNFFLYSSTLSLTFCFLESFILPPSTPLPPPLLYPPLPDLSFLTWAPQLPADLSSPHCWGSDVLSNTKSNSLRLKKLIGNRLEVSSTQTVVGAPKWLLAFSSIPLPKFSPQACIGSHVKAKDVLRVSFTNNGDFSAFT